MTWFSLPPAQAAAQSAFHSAESASAWLAAQPQANTPVMLAGFQAQIEAFNRLHVSARERFKTMEVLRKAIFAVSNDCRRRIEGKPLPLSGAEYTVLESLCRLWRAYAAGYQQCLQACLDGDAGLSGHAARVAHRVVFCLRMEQFGCYAAGLVPGNGLWAGLHAVFLAADKLGVVEEKIEDRLPSETSESTLRGQYAMALMLHLARPFMLSSGHFAAVVRWLARWREQAEIAEQAASDVKEAAVALDLSVDRPIYEGKGESYLPRWLVLGGVLRKIRKRVEALAAGESPESLKLGSGLSAEVCTMLLETLGSHLRCPPPLIAADAASVQKLAVGTGLLNIYRLIGGGGLDEGLAPTSSGDSHLSADQLAVFGHVVREQAAPVEARLENWLLLQRERNELGIMRLPGGGSARLGLRSLLAIRQLSGFLLGVVTGLQQQHTDGTLYGTVDLLPGSVIPRAVEIRDRISGKNERHPAFQLSTGKEGTQDMLLLPAGVMVRASVVRFFDGSGQAMPSMRLADCLERGGEVEFWRIAAA